MYFSNMFEGVPLPKERETSEEYFGRWHAWMAPSGVYGINIPAKYQGLDLGHWDRFCAISELSRINPSAGQYCYR